MPSQTQSHSNHKVKVGFDLDGVLFFNPLRIVRKPIEIVKRNILHRDTMNFYVPKSRLEKLLWKLVHMSSLRPASGWERIRELTKEGHIEPYLITARFKCLEKDFIRCLNSLHASDYFAGCYQNSSDEQPHLFKERMIKELGIEYYIEDNWNIVSHLATTTKAKVLWITNAFDASISYEPRFPSLKDAISALEKMLP